MGTEVTAYVHLGGDARGAGMSGTSGARGSVQLGDDVALVARDPQHLEQLADECRQVAWMMRAHAQEEVPA